MKPIAIALFLFCAVLLSPRAWGVTATYTNSSQNVTLTGLGGSNGVGQSRVEWGDCAFDGASTNCTVSAPYTGVGGGGTISIVLSYSGNGTSPFLANSISPGSNFVSFALPPGSSGSIVVSLTESTSAKVTFLSDNFVFYYSNAICTVVAATSCSVGQVGLTPNATITGTVYGSFDDTPVIGAVVTASSYGEFAAVAPGSWMEIYGTNLANVTSQNWTLADFNGNTAPTSVGGTSVTIGGQPAFIDYVSPGQVNAQVPSSIETGPQPVVVYTPGGTSAAYTTTVNVTEPGLLAPLAFKLPAGQYIAAFFADGFFVLPPNAVSGVSSARAKPGDEIVLYGVGFGTVTPDSPAGQEETQSNQINGSLVVSFAGVPAQMPYDGLAGGFMGLYQINVVVPNVAASDTVPVTFSLNGTQGAQTLIIPVSN